MIYLTLPQFKLNVNSGSTYIECLSDDLFTIHGESELGCVALSSSRDIDKPRIFKTLDSAIFLIFNHFPNSNGVCVYDHR